LSGVCAAFSSSAFMILYRDVVVSLCFDLVAQPPLDYRDDMRLLAGCEISPSFNMMPLRETTVAETASLQAHRTDRRDSS
jgi:hypothetical protein